MKAKYTLMLLGMMSAVAVWAQETDDMYFNSKDREQIVAANNVVMAKRYQQEDINAVRTNPVNPSDSYSGRGINPEFNAQAKNGTQVIQNNPDYFIANYQPTNVNKNLYGGNAMTGYPYYGGTSSYGMGYSPYSSMYSPYGMGMYSPMSMYSPYGMSPYGMSPYGMSPYGMMGMSGLSMSMGYGFGGYGSGFYSGIGYGMGSMYGPSSMFWNVGMGSFYGMYPYGSPYSYGYAPAAAYYSDAPSVVHGRHPARSSGLNNYVDNSRSAGMINGTNGRARMEGRAAGTVNNYYDRSWKNTVDNYGSMSNGSGWNGGGNSRSSFWNNNNAWDGGSRSSFGSSNFGSRSGGFGGGGFSGGGGGGGGHSRGR